MRLVYLTLGWLAGLLLAAQFPVLTVRVWSGLLVASLALLYLIWHTRLRWPWLITVMLLAGALRLSLLPATAPLAGFNGQSLAAAGVVHAEPEVRDDRLLLRLDITSVFDGVRTTPTSGLLLAVVPRTTDVRYGDRVSVAGQLVLPGEFDTFSYTDYLARQGIHSLMRAATLTLQERGQPHDVTAALIDLRERARRVINEALPQPYAGLLTGILTGDERDISPALSDSFSVAGASHIVAISGFNMAVLSGLMTVVLGRLRVPPLLVVVLTITLLALYTAFVGGTPSVLRAAFMSGVVLIAPLLRRRTYLPATLAFAALALTVLDPFSLWDVGFQLSFLAIVGILVLVEPMQRAYDRWQERALSAGWVRSWADWLGDLVLVTLAAQIATTPLLALYFQQVSVVSLLVNMLILPVQAVLLILGLVALVIGLLLPALAALLFPFVWLLLAWTIGIVRAFAGLPFATASLLVSGGWVALFYALLIGGIVINGSQRGWWQRQISQIRRYPVRRALIITGMGLLLLVAALIGSRPDGQLHVWWLDMGRSNAVLLQTPNGSQILVDGGRYPTRLLAALGDRMALNDRQLELVILTQPDDYDNSALVQVAQYYTIGALVTNGQPNASPVQAQLAEQWHTVPQMMAAAGARIETSDGVTLEILNPNDLPTLATDLGVATLVVRVTYGERSFLLTSDVSREQQAVIAARWNVRADVMQLPAHGAPRTLSSDWLDEVQPSLVVFSADRASNVTDDTTLRLLEDIPVLRTDEIGTIHLVSDGEQIWQWP